MFIEYAPPGVLPPRRMRVNIPSHEQLAVWQSIGEQFTRLGAEWDADQVVTANLPFDHPDAVEVRRKQNRQATRGVGRSLKLIKTILADPADHDWVDDMIMEGHTINEMMKIVSLTVDTVRRTAVTQSAGTRASEPATAAVLSE
jgi:hypothetical protein